MNFGSKYVKIILAMATVFLIYGTGISKADLRYKMLKGSVPGLTADMMNPGKNGNPIDQPDPKAYKRLRHRQRLLEKQIRQIRETGRTEPQLRRQLKSAQEPMTSRILVILVEFGGTDTFTWIKGESSWDPLGKPDLCEDTKEYKTILSGEFAPFLCSSIDTESGEYTYSGPLHNQIEKPLTAKDEANGLFWSSDFNPEHYKNLIFGNGVKLSYTRQDGTQMNENLTGKSVADYISDMSDGRHQIIGDVLGWVQIPHSTWYYGADFCPGGKSAYEYRSYLADGAIPDAGNTVQFITDTLDAAKNMYPDFDWSQYDQDKDRMIDNLWIIHAGLGEEGDISVTDYGEGAIWSVGGRIMPYEIVPDIYASSVVIVPENCGAAVLSHEFLHTLGAVDLYAYMPGNTSAGIWTLMADSWNGYPIGAVPNPLDPLHLENLGWLDPKLIVNPENIYNITIGQASGEDNIPRCVKISLADQEKIRTVQPVGSYQWWGGDYLSSNSMMTMKNPISIPDIGATLTLSLAYDTESSYDFLWVQVSDDSGTTWKMLTNENTVCEHESDWIGGFYDFPDDLCEKGIRGFTGFNKNFPLYDTETFDMNDYAGRDILLRFWYMTDWGTNGAGPFIDEIRIISGADMIFADNAENGDSHWDYTEDWERVTGAIRYTHNYYLQWRNVTETGGFDSVLGDSRSLRGQANTGLLVWYNNNYYSDNEIYNYLTDDPSFGPKGLMLVVDAHPKPYNLAAQIYDDTSLDYFSNRIGMKDATFSLKNSADFILSGDDFKGLPGVSLFSDTLGYFPGAEYILPWPDYPDGKEWMMSKIWDISVVIPSAIPYSISAPGYTGDERIGYHAIIPQSGCDTNEEDEITADWFDGLGYPGGTGNPGDVGGEYGWNVQILSQTDEEADICIWNTHYTTLYVLTAVKSGGGKGTITSSANQIDCGLKCVAMCEPDTIVTLTAESEKGSVFTGWSGGGCSGTGDCTAALQADTTVTAVFKLRGDVDGNEKLDIFDALLIAEYDAKLKTEAQIPGIAFADVNGDGKTDINDALAIAMLDAGVVSDFD